MPTAAPERFSVRIRTEIRPTHNVMEVSDSETDSTETFPIYKYRVLLELVRVSTTTTTTTDPAQGRPSRGALARFISHVDYEMEERVDGDGGDQVPVSKRS
jgi:hypothetical protein